jgi:5'-nucleotidase / UDP-sugar diphosphatase
MNHTRRLIHTLAVICLLALCLPGCSWSKPEYRAFTILYTNDIHDHLIPFSYPDPVNPRVGYAGMSARMNIGGIARLATLAHRIKKETHDDALLMDAGDVMEGTPFGLEYDGQQDYDTLAAVGYNIAVPGNHDFRCTLDVFRRHTEHVPFRVVCANLLDRKTGKPELPEYDLYNVQGLKIAVFGVTVMSPEWPAAKEGLDFTDPVEAAKRLVPELRKKADIVIALSHLGEGEDEKLAKDVPGIDVIVGGHSHTRLPKPRFIASGGAQAPFAINGTLVVQDFENGAELGRLDLRLKGDNGHYSIMSYTGKLIPVTSDIPEDPATAKVIAKYYKPIEAKYGGVIGTATETFFTDPAVQNLICDSMREETGADVAMYGVGGVRGDLVKGTLRAWDVATAIPYSNKINLLDMTGEQVKEILVRFPVKPCVSGMRYHMSGNNIIEATIAGKEIDDKAMYKVATIDWLVSLYFKNMKVSKELDVTAREAIVNYIKAHKTVTPVIDGRRNAE